jgi:hypothetical protein
MSLSDNPRSARITSKLCKFGIIDARIGIPSLFLGQTESAFGKLNTAVESSCNPPDDTVQA